MAERTGAGRRGAPLVVFDAGYSAAALTAALASCPVHLLIRLPSGSVFYADPVAWPGEKGRLAGTACRLPATTTPARATLNPMSRSPCRTRRSMAPSGSMPGARSTPSSTVTAGGSPAGTASCPVLRGTVLRVTVDHLPMAASPRRRCGCGTPGPHPRTDRPVGPPGHGRGRPAAAARPPARRRPAPPLGKAARPGPAPTGRAGPPRISKHLALPGHPRPCSANPPGQAQGLPQRPGTPLPGG